ncbi:MAG: ferric reductase-like transmembrane domain-containing protein [Raoultibacter sp.]
MPGERAEGMTFALILALTFIAAIALAGAIRELPWLFYGLAVLVVMVLFAGMYGFIEGGWWKPLIFLIKRCMLAFSLFVVVMFVGALRKDSKLGIRMRLVRSELSIVACILCAGHVCLYLVPYTQRALSGTLQDNIVASFTVAILLFVLLLVLGITSFDFVKKRMKAADWKRIQRLAYLFFLFTYVHLMFMLVPAAVNGGISAIENIICYSAVFLLYVVMRLRRKRLDSQLKKEEAEER